MTQALLNEVSAKLMIVAGCLEVEFHINPRIIMIFWPIGGLAPTCQSYTLLLFF
jgi:hypothetical protein